MNDNLTRRIFDTKPGQPVEWGHICPRRLESGTHDPTSPFVSPFVGAGTGLDGWDRTEATCTYCGSLDPAVFMARLEAGTVELEPTDKNYKVYVRNHGGDPFLLMYRTDDQPTEVFDPAKCTWVTEQRDSTKFYFQHFSRPQMIRFIELLNAKRVSFGGSNGFYVRPFFIAPRLRANGVQS